ncbi:hypothetical protein TNCV_5077571 [Trichonephila clavipes]|uniref:Uncharacterized protein n=1 Tax=Trichonephila clavipes TaxID=2585209 RepID=A0A8X6RYK7_TRICX|nr:hypothetical protein TNCV_5077571 [Trichonephila clavipes]
MACQVTRSFANRGMSGRWESGQLQPSRYRRINCADAIDYGRIFHGVISDLIESMPRRISNHIARGGFTTY